MANKSIRIEGTILVLLGPGHLMPFLLLGFLMPSLHMELLLVFECRILLYLYLCRKIACLSTCLLKPSSFTVNIRIAYTVLFSLLNGMTFIAFYC